VSGVTRNGALGFRANAALPGSFEHFNDEHGDQSEGFSRTLLISPQRGAGWVGHRARRKLPDGEEQPPQTEERLPRLCGTSFLRTGVEDLKTQAPAVIVAPRATLIADKHPQQR